MEAPCRNGAARTNMTSRELARGNKSEKNAQESEKLTKFPQFAALCRKIGDLEHQPECLCTRILRS